MSDDLAQSLRDYDCGRCTACRRMKLAAADRIEQLTRERDEAKAKADGHLAELARVHGERDELAATVERLREARAEGYRLTSLDLEAALRERDEALALVAELRNIAIDIGDVLVNQCISSYDAALVNQCISSYDAAMACIALGELRFAAARAVLADSEEVGDES